jgi:hypothetical protein
MLAFTLAGVALAATFNVTFSAGQDTVIQSFLPLLNSEKCLRFGLPTNCSSANLVTKGCVAASLTRNNFEACTIYTIDSTGEGLMLQDEVSYRLLETSKRLNLVNQTSFLQTCKAGNQALQDSICTAAGLSAGCNPCP